MKTSAIRGASFGLTSGIITTLGLMVGLGEGTGSRGVVVGGILTIAIADALSDALGIHISEESDSGKSEKEVWMATLFTLITKFVFASLFVIPVLLMPLNNAIYASIGFGLISISALSYYIARSNRENPMHVILEHMGIAVLVIILTYGVGVFVASNFSI